jgi:hypothetical protein
MKLFRMVAVLALMGGLAGVAFVNQATEPSGVKMAVAAQDFLDTLSPELKAKATFAFDDKERTNWYFTPQESKAKQPPTPTRKGVRLEEMNDTQKAAALNLLKAGTSDEGFKSATTIMSMEEILKVTQKSGPTRNTGWYFFTIFGTPSKAGKWGWRVEGHHLSMNFTIDSGKVVSATPTVFGANPATVKEGPQKGLRAIPATDDLAKELFLSLDEEQKKAALQGKQFPEIQEAKAAPNLGEPRGLPATKMNDKQKALLMKLIETYSGRWASDISATELTQIKEAGLDQIHFGFAGSVEDGKQRSYRVQGPTFGIEFLNLQADVSNNPANHIHSGLRRPKGDFGLDAK